MKIKSRGTHMTLDEIKIPKSFKNHPPRAQKILARYEHYNATRCFDREIVVDDDNTLVDGYSVYLAARMLDLKQIRVLKIASNYSLQELLQMASAECENIVMVGA